MISRGALFKALVQNRGSRTSISVFGRDTDIGATWAKAAFEGVGDVEESLIDLAALDTVQRLFNLDPSRCLNGPVGTDFVDINAASYQAASAREQSAAAVLAARARVRQAELNLSYTEVKAPIEGVTGRALQSVGTLVSPNAESALLTTMTRADPIWVRFALAEGEYARLRGSEEIQVQVELADGKPYPLPGKLNFAGSTVDAATGTVQMRAELPNPKLDLLPGQYVRVRVQAGTQQAFVVPQTAVAQNESGRFVWVMADGKAAQRQIRAGNWLGSDWVVLDGLKPGDKVITDNLVRLRPGVLVVSK